MARGRRRKDASKTGNGATLGFEEKLWQAADKLRGSHDAAVAADVHVCYHSPPNGSSCPECALRSLL